MKDNTLTIRIERPTGEVFWFALNPKNSPGWFNVDTEETNEWPVKLGSEYRNRSGEKSWSEYIVTEFDQPSTFALSEIGSSYHVRYTFKAVSDQLTELEYREWVDEGELQEPFSLGYLQNLKKLIEQSS